MSASHPLDGDGVNHLLFQYLSKDATTMLAKRKGNKGGTEPTNSSDESTSDTPPAPRGRTKKAKRKRAERTDSPDFQIPDTVVFFNTPTTWYFWDHTSQKCEKKDAKALEKENLEHFFGQSAGRDCDICCTFLVRNQGEADSVLFLNKEGLHDFLYSRPEHHGLLQRFIAPPSDHNYMYQAVWCRRGPCSGNGSTQVFKRVSRHKLKERNTHERRGNPAKEGYLSFAPLARHRLKSQRQFEESIKANETLLLSPGTKLSKREETRKKELLSRLLCVSETKTLNGEMNKAAKLCKELSTDFETNSQHYEKAITFEGASHYAEEKWCHSGIHQRIQRVCQRIVDHLEAIDHTYSIARMVAYFKEDAAGRLWLMFSTAMRVQEARQHRSPSPQTENRDVYRFTGALTPNFKGVFSPDEEEARPSSAGASGKGLSPSLFSTKAAAMHLKQRLQANRAESNAAEGRADSLLDAKYVMKRESDVPPAAEELALVSTQRCTRSDVRPYATPGNAQLSSATSPKAVPLYAETLTTMQRMAHKNRLISKRLKVRALASQTSAEAVKNEIARFASSNATLRAEVLRYCFFLLLFLYCVESFRRKRRVFLKKKILSISFSWVSQISPDNSTLVLYLIILPPPIIPLSHYPIHSRQEEVKVLGGVHTLQQCGNLPPNFGLTNIFANEGHLAKGGILHMPLKEVHERRQLRRRRAQTVLACLKAGVVLAMACTPPPPRGTAAARALRGPTAHPIFSAFKKVAAQDDRKQPRSVKRSAAAVLLQGDGVVFDCIRRSYEAQPQLRCIGGRLFTLEAHMQHYARYKKKNPGEVWRTSPCEAPSQDEIAVASTPADAFDDQMYSVYSEVAVLRHPVLHAGCSASVAVFAAKHPRSAFVVEQLARYFPKDFLFDVPPNVASILIPRFEADLSAMKIYPFVPEVEYARVVAYLSDKIPVESRCPGSKAGEVESLEQAVAEAQSRLNSLKRVPSSAHNPANPLTCIIRHGERGTMPEFNRMMQVFRSFLVEPIATQQKRMLKGLKTHITLSRGVRRELRQF